MSLLPWPSSSNEIRSVLDNVDNSLLRSSEKFVRRQSSKAIDLLTSHTSACYSPKQPQYFWLNVLALFSANQQLNEACNKMWATAELANITRVSVWRRKYDPVGPGFGGIFVSSTLIPTLYYAQISAMISLLASFGCLPILSRGVPFYLVRTQEGWKAYNRRVYVASVCGRKINGWHEQIIETYFSLTTRNISLPRLPQRDVAKLKELRNEMHYNILGDLKMWRTPARRGMIAKLVPVVDNTIVSAICVLRSIKSVSTGCDERYSSLRESMKKRLKLL